MSWFRIGATLSLDGSKFEAGLSRARSAASSFASTVTNEIGNRLAGMFALGALEELTRRTVEFAGHMVELADRTGISVEELQRLAAAAKDYGTSVDTITGSLDKINAARAEALSNPEGKQAAAFKQLGVDQETLKNSSAYDIVQKIALEFQNSTNVEALTAPLLEVAGRGAGEMVGLMRAGWTQMYQDASVMTEAMADELKDLGDIVEEAGQTILVSFAPVITGVVNSVKRIWDTLSNFFTALMVVASKLFGRNQNQTVGELWTDAWNQSEEENKKQREEEEKRKKERRENRKRARQNLNFEPKEEKEDKKTKDTKEPKQDVPKVLTDSLSGVGNFLGQSQAAVVSIAQRQLFTLGKIELNTRYKKNEDHFGADA